MNNLILTDLEDYSANLVENKQIVLIVDDDEDMLLTLESILEEPGRKMLNACSGEEALNLLSQYKVSLVLLDVQMPGMSGYQTAQNIRAQAQFSDLPLLFVTATHNSKDMINYGFSVGAHDYISKPVDSVLLRNKVGIFLRLYRQQQNLKYELEHRLVTESALRLSSIVFEHSPEAVLITDENGVIKSVNKSFERTTGYNRAEAIGRTPEFLRSGYHDHKFYEDIKRKLSDTGQWQGEIWNRAKNGEIYPEWLNVVSVYNDIGSVVNYVGIFSDLSGRDQLRERLHQFTFFDPLTGLPNRQMYFDRLEVALASSRRDNEGLAVVLLKLGRLDSISNIFGHQVGDALIQSVAKQIKDQLCDSCTLAIISRYEFGLILTRQSGNRDVARLVMQVLSMLTKSIYVSEQEHHLNANAGISVFPEDGNTAEDLFNKASTALLRSIGDNIHGAFQFYTPEMSVSSQERLLLEADLRQAIDMCQLTLVYQPQFSILTGALTGVEALARWHHPEQGSIPPYRFIPVAEEAGLIGSLGAWALKTACEQAAHWFTQHGRYIRVAVNVSALQFYEENFAQTVADCLMQTGLPAEWLDLELTESMLMSAAEKTILMLQSLSQMGVQLSIDDFGTGYSSLSYLKRFSINKIKIDRSFVKDIPGGKNDIAIIEAIIAMAHRINLKVVAEGVETDAQLEFLRRAECDEFQGYLFSPPVHVYEIDKFIGGSDNLRNNRFLEGNGRDR